MTNTAPQTFNILSEMKTVTGTDNVQVLLLGLNTVNDNNGGTYRWDSINTTSDDGFLTIQVTGVTNGRWIRVGNANTLKGNSIFSGTGLASSFNVVFPSALPFTPNMVILQAQSANAVRNWYTNLTNTGFTANFETIPLLGSNNISFGWIVIKQ